MVGNIHWIAILLGVVLPLKLATTWAFLVSSSFGRFSSELSVTRKPRDSIQEIVLPNRTRDSETNFWFAVERKDSEKNGKLPKLPATRFLDKDGPLPPGAYRMFGKEQYEPKQFCALSIAVDLVPPVGRDTIDADEIISGLQKSIESGLTTFSLALPSQPPRKRPRGDMTEDENIELLCPSNQQTWGEENVYRKLRQSLPGTVKESCCHLVVPMMTPSARATANHVSRSLVREAITESISRIGADSIDTLQLQYCEGSPYHMEMMDHLLELQRDGLIKSISGKGFNSMALRGLKANGFEFDSHEMGINLMDSSLYNADTQLAASDLDLPIIVSNPLAGGLLTNRWDDRLFPPLSQEMTAKSQHKYMTQTLRKWAMTRQLIAPEAVSSELKSWDQYQNKLLPELQLMARYYEVSVASIALRWALQLDHVGSTVVRCNMMKETDDRPRSLSTRLKHLRDVFRFELNQEDMDRLWELSQPPARSKDQEEQEENEELRRMMKNRSLWL